jgi:polyphosphate kinase
LLTARPEFGADLVELFNYLTGFSKQQSFRRLLVAPVTLRSRMEGLIRRELEHAQAGRGGLIRAKMNSLVDPAIIALLYEASQAGVQIELVVRGMCSLRPGLAGISDNIRVVSVIGRFLEHSRIFWFGNGGESELFIGSADWMSRNLDRRVEAVAPIEDPRLRHQLEQILDLYLHDTGAWHMDSQGHFSQRQHEGEAQLVQREMMRRWRGGLVPTS